MYQPRARHPLSAIAPSEPEGVEDAMWDLFVAIGEFWKLGDDPAGYRERFKTFMDNRISLNPIYEGFYAATKRLIDDLTAQQGSISAYETILTKKDRKLPSGHPENDLECIKVYVANKFI